MPSPVAFDPPLFCGFATPERRVVGMWLPANALAEAVEAGRVEASARRSLAVVMDMHMFTSDEGDAFVVKAGVKMNCWRRRTRWARKYCLAFLSPDGIC